MIKDDYGQIIFTGEDITETFMTGTKTEYKGKLPGPFLIDDDNVDVEKTNKIAGYTLVEKYLNEGVSVAEFDKKRQQEWLMPKYYKEFDIAKFILDQCENDAELQRCGEELLLYIEHNLIDLLKYLKYLVDVMQSNNIIWGVGRGSSVSSFVLYKMKIHRINSLYYDLDIREFLR